MTRRRRIPRFLRAALRGRRAGFLPQGDTFLRGVALGALVGAAIAGSTIWNRLRSRAGEQPAERNRRSSAPTT